MDEVDTDDLEIDRNHCRWYFGRPFTGVAIERDVTGTRLAEIEFIDGSMHGTATFWHPNGQMKMSLTTAFNMEHGIAKVYSPEGNVIEESEFEFGVCLWRKRCGPNGEAVEDYSIEQSPSAKEVLEMNRRTFIPQLLRTADDRRQQIAGSDVCR